MDKKLIQDIKERYGEDVARHFNMGNEDILQSFSERYGKDMMRHYANAGKEWAENEAMIEEICSETEKKVPAFNGSFGETVAHFIEGHEQKKAQNRVNPKKTFSADKADLSDEEQFTNGLKDKYIYQMADIVEKIETKLIAWYEKKEIHLGDADRRALAEAVQIVSDMARMLWNCSYNLRYNANLYI